MFCTKNLRTQFRRVMNEWVCSLAEHVRGRRDGVRSRPQSWCSLCYDGRCFCGSAANWGCCTRVCRCCRQAREMAACARSVCVASDGWGTTGFCCMAGIESLPHLAAERAPLASLAALSSSYLQCFRLSCSSSKLLRPPCVVRLPRFQIFDG